MTDTDRLWELAPLNPSTVRDLAVRMGVLPALAAVYLHRGLETAEQVCDFCDLGPHRLHDPLLLPDIEPALDRLCRALDTGERIFVFGDYDADGVTATAVMVRALQALKANLQYHVPERIKDGYDLRPSTVDLALAAGARLILSVDCGILAFEASAYAQERGVDLVITDHHNPDPEGRLPDAAAVIHPKRLDSRYPFPGLAGVGVAYKLAQALCLRRGIPEALAPQHLLEYVALGTVADLAPMLDENRSLVAMGCDRLNRTDKPGVRELLRVSGARRVDSASIGFGLGPRLNAVGRLMSPRAALELLLTRDPTEARTLAAQLDSANRTRQDLSQQTVEEALLQIPAPGELPETYILVVAGEDWHPGLVGLVAGRLAEKFNRPAVACSLATGEIARGSCRSAGDFDILRALRSPGCRPLLEECGGHAFAAGFGIRRENIPLLRERLNEYARLERSGQGPVHPLRLEARLRPEEITLDLCRALNRLAPFGPGNPDPLFLATGLVVIGSSVTRDGEHLRLQFTRSGAPPLQAMAWKRGPSIADYPNGAVLDIAFTLSLNDYRSALALQVNIQELRGSANG